MTLFNNTFYCADKVGTKQDLINSYPYKDAVFWYITAIHIETGFRFEGCYFRLEMGQSYVMSNNWSKLSITDHPLVYNIVDSYNEAQKHGFVPVTVARYEFFTDN